MEDPKYIQLYKSLRNLIILGTYETGSFLPTEAKLMNKFSASRTTVRHALGKLQEEKYIKSVQGRGSEVLSLPYDSMRKATRSVYTEANFTPVYNIDEPWNIRVSPPIFDVVSAPYNVVKLFGAFDSPKACRIQTIQYVNNNLYAYRVQYLRYELYKDFFNSPSPHDTYRFLTNYSNLHFLRAEENYGAVAADLAIASILKINVGDPLLEYTRTSYCENGVFEYSTFYAIPKFTSYHRTVIPNDSTLIDKKN